MDLIVSILFLKWSEKSSHAASDGGMEDLLKSLFIKRSIVLKGNFWLFLFSMMRFEKWMVLACLTELL